MITNEKKYLITGVHGYIGNALKDKLIEQGHQVDQINVRNQLWSLLLQDYDVLIHTAALVHNNSPQARLSDYMQVNMLLTKQLAQKAKAEDVKQFIFMILWQFMEKKKVRLVNQIKLIHKHQ